MEKVYLVGIEYDDFSDGRFAVVAVCDSREEAENMVNKAYIICPYTEMKDISVREININKFYNDWI